MTDVTAADVVAALYAHFSQRYAVLTEVTIADTESVAAWREWREMRVDLTHAHDSLDPIFRRADVLLWAPDDMIAVEVKVTRADFNADVADPAKQRAWRAAAHRHAYAVPEGLVSADEVPTGSGLLTVLGMGVGWARRAPRVKDDRALPAGAVFRLMKRLSRAEGQLKGYAHTAAETDVEVLRAQLANADRKLLAAGTRAQQAWDRADRYRRLHAHCDPPPCASCGEPVVPKWDRFEGWRHRDSAADDSCLAKRMAAAVTTYGYRIPKSIAPRGGSDFLVGC